MASRRLEEQRIHGRNACLAVHATRPEAILRAFVAEDGLGEFGPLLRTCAAMRRPYRLVPRAELDAVAESTHHEGICLVVRPREETHLEDVVDGAGARLVLGLDGVRNPHNLGAIVRVAAHFGVDALVVDEGAPRLAGAAARTAEGGAEHVPLVRVRRMQDAVLAARRAGFTTLGTSSHVDGARSIYAAPFPARALLLFGAEGEGLPDALLRAADALVTVPGTGAVESLNVATAVAVCLGEARRSRATSGTSPPLNAHPNTQSAETELSPRPRTKGFSQSGTPHRTRNPRRGH